MKRSREREENGKLQVGGMAEDGLCSPWLLTRLPPPPPPCSGSWFLTLYLFNVKRTKLTTHHPPTFSSPARLCFPFFPSNTMKASKDPSAC